MIMIVDGDPHTDLHGIKLFSEINITFWKTFYLVQSNEIPKSILLEEATTQVQSGNG